MDDAKIYEQVLTAVDCRVCNSGMTKVSKLRYRSLTGNLKKINRNDD